MKHLIQLELSKFKLNRYFIASIFITIAICIFTTISLFASEQEKATCYMDSIKLVTAAVVDCYLIFTGVLASKVIVEEYVNGTASILFTYTISRKKVMMAKVGLILTVSILLSAVTNIISIIYLNAVMPFLQLSLNEFALSDFLYWLMQFLWDMIIMAALVLIICSVAFMKKISQFTFMMSLVALIIAQILISQDMQAASILLLPISIFVINVAIKRYGCNLEKVM